MSEYRALVRRIRMNTLIELQQPRLEKSDPLLLAGLSCHYTTSTVRNIPEQWQRFGPQIGNIPGQVGRVAYGVCFNMSDDEDGFDYLSGVEVTDFSLLPEEMDRLALPAQSYLVFAHLEHVSKVGDTIHAIFTSWFPSSAFQRAPNSPFFERYGEKFDVESGRGDVEIWIPVKQ
jgi:AraC family transcriptional regulator